MNGKNVPESVVRSWPGRIMNPLFKKAKEISEMDTPSTAEEIKNQIDKLQEQHTKMLEDKDSLGNDSDSMEDT